MERIAIINQIRINELNNRRKDTINTLVKKVYPKSQITKTSKPRPNNLKLPKDRRKRTDRITDRFKTIGKNEMGEKGN